jgi:hypothetical protein
MAIEFNVTATLKFFLGDDKLLDFTIFGQDGVTPFDVSGLVMEWSIKKTDKALDPPIISKTTVSGITIIGVYNVSPAINTQRVRVTFASADTDPDVTSVLPTPYTLKANVAYRHSLKRMTSGLESVLSYGSFTFLQATER